MTTAIQNQNQPAQTPQPLNETFLNDIEKHIKDKNFPGAFNNLCLLFIDIREKIPEDQIQQIYSYLKTLIPHLDAKQIETLQNDAFDPLNLFPTLHENQMELALDLGNWFFKQPHYLQAMHYFAKAIIIAETHHSKKLKNIHAFASKIFMKIIEQQSDQFCKRLNKARGEAVHDKFKAIFDEIENLKQYIYDEQDHLTIKGFYEKARDVLIHIPKASKEKFSCFSQKIQVELTNKSFHLQENCITEKYREALLNFRKKFIHPPLEIKDFEKVQKFQEEITQEFLQLLREKFFRDAFIFLGPPPCSYDIRVMGSLARGELCPFSDMEWMILIENEKHLEYFKNLSQIIELQIISLGETAATNLPVFSCIHHINQSGFHVDAGASPAQADLIKTPKQMANFQLNLDPDPRLPFHSLRKTRSLMCNDPSLFQTYAKEMENILYEKKNENSTIGQKYALGLIEKHLQEYQKLFKDPLDKQTIINVKEQFVQLINYCLNDLALFYSIPEVNTLEIIDALIKKEVFTKSSERLLKEAVAAIYMIRIRLHCQYQEQVPFDFHVK